MSKSKNKAEQFSEIGSEAQFVPKGIIGIDPATKCGWAISISGGVVRSGVWNFTRRAKEHKGGKMVKFEKRLRFLITNFKPIYAVGIEMPVTGFAGATIHHSKLLGIAEKVCAEEGVRLIETPPNMVKQFATGKGNAKKNEMVEAAIQHLGASPEDDNEADALWILHYTNYILNNE